MRTRRPLLLLLVALAVVLAAGLVGCGDDDASADGTDRCPPPLDDERAAALPATVASGTRMVTIEQVPARIVSLSPTATEMLFAIGACDQVVAVDEYSTHPPEAPRTELSGFTPSVEAIAAFEPDLVVVSFDPESFVDQLAALGIAVIVQDAAANLEETYAQMADLGAATGNLEGAAAAIADLRRAVDELLAQVPDHARGLTYFHQLDDTLYTVTSSTFVGEVYAMVGLVNIADAADGGGTGYPQLSAEYVIDRDPDLVFLAGQPTEAFTARPGFDRIAAVRDGLVFELDGDVASRWGPRTVELLAAVVEAVSSVPATSAT